MISYHPLRRCLWLAAAFVIVGLAAPASEQDTVCASVKIRIQQELTMERQAFDAEMKTNNTTDNGVIENVKALVRNGVSKIVASSSYDQNIEKTLKS